MRLYLFSPPPWFECEVIASNASGSVAVRSAPLYGPFVVVDGPPIVSPAPANLVAPTVSWNPLTRRLRCSPGEWTGVPQPSLTYQWLENTGSVPGATQPLYAPSPLSAASFECEVTAANAAGRASARSASLHGPFVVIELAPPLDEVALCRGSHGIELHEKDALARVLRDGLRCAAAPARLSSLRKTRILAIPFAELRAGTLTVKCLTAKTRHGRGSGVTAAHGWLKYPGGLVRGTLGAKLTRATMRHRHTLDIACRATFVPSRGKAVSVRSKLALH
jgi:hypothetical protein